MNKNDEKILNLKKKIEDKKKFLKGKKTRFAPITNCILKLDSEQYNLHVIPKNTLVFLLVKLNMYYESAKQLKVQDDLIFNNYKIDEWIEDIKSKLEIDGLKDEENKLKEMEKNLTKLLSEEKKTELEIDEIEKMLDL